MHDRGADLPNIRIAAEALERRATTTLQHQVAARATARAAFVGDVAEAEGSRELDAVPIGGVFHRNVFHLILVDTARNAEAAEGRAVVTDTVLRIAVAVRPDAATRR